MSCKSNGIKLTKCESQQWKTASILEPPSVKLAGEEAKDRLYEPKHNKKAVRVLTVIAYVFFVSLAAIMLSLYYVFLWNGEEKVAAKLIAKQRQYSQQNGAKCENTIADIQRLIRMMETQPRPGPTVMTAAAAAAVMVQSMVPTVTTVQYPDTTADTQDIANDEIDDLNELSEISDPEESILLAKLADEYDIDID